MESHWLLFVWALLQEVSISDVVPNATALSRLITSEVQVLVAVIRAPAFSLAIYCRVTFAKWDPQVIFSLQPYYHINASSSMRSCAQAFSTFCCSVSGCACSGTGTELPQVLIERTVHALPRRSASVPKFGAAWEAKVYCGESTIKTSRPVSFERLFVTVGGTVIGPDDRVFSRSTSVGTLPFQLQLCYSENIVAFV